MTNKVSPTTPAPSAPPEMKADIKQWLTEQCNRLRYGRCNTLYCLKRGGYTGEPADVSISTCEPYEIHEALKERL